MRRPPGQRLGRIMLIRAWAAALFLATHFFGRWEESRENPNPAPASLHTQNYIEVRLAGDGRGHLTAGGQIHGTPVRVLRYTGATDVAVAGQLAGGPGLGSGV